MKKYSKLLVGVLGSVMVLGGAVSCGNQGGNNPGPTPGPVVTTYKVVVTAPSGVTYTLNKTEAQKGEEIVLTITGTAPGQSITKVSMNSSEVTETSANVYKFNMPNESARVQISVAVSGEVTLVGDIAAALTKNEETGIYELKNYLVTNGTNAEARFSYAVNGEKVSCIDFNTSRSFGDIGIAREKDFELTVACNAYYDFYYDPSLTVDPCYIQRVGVAVLPSSISELESMLMTSPGPGSEYCYNVNDLIGIDYTVKSIDGSDNKDYIRQTYNWKMYANNVSFAKVIDKDQMDEETDMYVYKHLDVENKTLTVVDTYKKYNNNLVANDDPNREHYNDGVAYSARYALIEGDDYDYRRFSKNIDHANDTFKVSAHMPGTLVEREFAWGYRVGITSSDAVTYYSVPVVSTLNPDGSFVTTVNSIIEKNFNGSVYESAAHEAITWKIEIGFDQRGAMTSLVAIKKFYDIAAGEWDLAKHEPAPNKKGKTLKDINATYTYGTATATLTDAMMEDEGFVLSDYFLASVSELQIYNPVTKEDETTGKSAVHLGDDIILMNDSCRLDSKVKKFVYAPSTALDIWQYAATESSDENIVRKMPNDLYCATSAVNAGTATLTFTNHHKGGAAGIEFTLDVKVCSVVKPNGFIMYDENDPYMSITNATPVMVRSGSTKTFNVVACPYSAPAAPCAYTAVSSNTSLAQVISAPNSTQLVIKFGSVTSQQQVKITMNADYDPSYTSSVPTVFTFYVIANDVDPVGRWGLLGYEDQAIITFTNDYMEGSTEWKRGTIEDTNGSQHLSATFVYNFTGVSVEARITTISITGTSESWSSDPRDYELYFQYDAPTKYYGVGLAEVVYDEYYEGKFYSPIYGECDGDGFVSYDPFVKLS